MNLLRVVFGYGFALAAILAPAGAQTSVATPEDQVKSALILGFVRYSEWPTATGTVNNALAAAPPLTVGVYGRPSLTRALTRVFAGKSISGRFLAARDVQTPSETIGCDILFIAADSRKQLSDMLAAVHDMPILTMGESDTILSLGGIVHLFEEDGKIRFAVSIDALSRSRVNVSAKLLQLGQMVRTRSR